VNFFRFGLVAIVLVALGVGLSKFVFNRESPPYGNHPVANSDLVSSDESIQNSSTNKPPDGKEDGDLASSKNVEKRTGTLKTKDLSIGASKKVLNGNKVTYHVFIQLMDGKVVFNSRSEGRPWSGTVGDGSILAGIDTGMRGMYQGGKRAIWIPAHLGYGRHGMSTQVPPNADLYAEVEIVSVF
jgi:peptidylprolyl isomerase